MGSLADRLRWAREASGLGARELDRLVNLSRGYIGLIESGRKANLEIKTATAIAHAVGVSLDWLVNGEGEAPSIRAMKRAAAAHLSKTGTGG